MAKPDLDNGYLMLAHELFAAVMTAHMPREARLVIVEVFSQIYGPARLRLATLSPTEIARRTGTHASGVARGIAFAIAQGILRREGLGAYAFVKDYESWGTPEGPLLAPGMTSYAAFATRLALSHAFAEPTQTPRTGRRRCAKEFNRSVNESTDASPNIPSDDPDPLTDRLTIVNGSVNPPPISKKREGEVVVEGAGEGAPTVTDPSTGTAAGPTPADARPALWGMVPFLHDPAEVDRVAATCGALAGPDADTIPPNVRRMARAFPLWYFRYAITRAVAVAPAGKVWAYAVAIMNSLWAQGVAEEPREAPRESPPFAPVASGPRPEPLSRAARKARTLDDAMSSLDLSTFKEPGE